MSTLIKKNHLDFYSCAAFLIENLFLLVKQVNRVGVLHFKFAGGTYMTLNMDKWREQGEEGNFYNITSRKDVQRCYLDLIEKVYGRYMNATARKKIPKILKTIDEFTQHNPFKIHLVCEWIEEMGIIPVSGFFDHLLENEIDGHMQYAFHVTEALALKAEEGKFIFIRKKTDLPVRGIDYDCVDVEVKETVLRTYEQLIEIAKDVKDQRVEKLHPDDRPQYVTKYVEAEIGETCDTSDGKKKVKVLESQKITFGRGIHTDLRNVLVSNLDKDSQSHKQDLINRYADIIAAKNASSLKKDVA